MGTGLRDPCRPPPDIQASPVRLQKTAATTSTPHRPRQGAGRGLPDLPRRHRHRGDHRRPGRLGHARRPRHLDMARCAQRRRPGAVVAAFFADLGTGGQGHPGHDQRVRPALVENGNRGLDHGWGNAMFLAGAGVKAARSTSRTTSGRPERRTWSILVVTTDYRNVLAEIVKSRFGQRFPAVDRVPRPDLRAHGLHGPEARQAPSSSQRVPEARFLTPS